MKNMKPTSNRTKILFICPFSLGTNHAGVVYTRQLLEKLSERCEIDLVSFHYKNDKEYVPCRNIHVVKKIEINTVYKFIGILSLLWIFPLFTARFNWKECWWLKTMVRENVYDFVYFDFSQSFAYSFFINHPHKILMAHDVMAQKFSRMKTYLRPWVLLSERKILKKGTVFTFSEKDSRLIKNLYGIESYPTTFFLSHDVQDAMPTEYGGYYVFFGGWIREENYESIEWYIDHVNPIIPNLQYKIIGGGLPQRIKEKLQYNFEYLGFVDNPYPIIANAKALIAPLRKGAGVKVKCIDALGCGTPVIGTDVAFEGIPIEFDDFMVHAETGEEFVDAITKLDFTIEERVRFKKFFMDKYNHKKILEFIEGKKNNKIVSTYSGA